jgi:hypothetical protein
MGGFEGGARLQLTFLSVVFCLLQQRPLSFLIFMQLIYTSKKKPKYVKK